MKKTICTFLSTVSILLTLWLMHYGSLIENSGALSKTGLKHPILFAIWGIITYLTLHLNIIYGLRKISRANRIYYSLSAIAGIGIILTVNCDFDYTQRIQYYLHCAGSLAFSAITGILAFILFLYQFHKNNVYKAFTIIIGSILIIDLILLIIFQETALIEAVPIIFGLIILPIFNFYIKDKEYVTQ